MDLREKGARQMIAVARKDHDEWMVEYRKFAVQGNDTVAEACLVGANTVEQLIKRMERELKSV
jgi:hypothetical protein